MKQDEIRIWLWLRNRTDHKNHARVIYVSERPSALTWIWNRSDKPYSCRLDEASRYFDAISTPAELSAAGVKDEDRLLCQRNVWDGVRFKTNVSYELTMVFECFVNQDYAFDVYADGKLKHGTHDQSITKDVTADAHELRSRADIAQAVTDFRSRRAGAEGKKQVHPNLTVRVGDLIGFDYDDGRAAGCWRVSSLSPPRGDTTGVTVQRWDAESATWIYDGRAWFHRWRFNTPAEIASTTIKLDDIANPELRAAVEALRRPTLKWLESVGCQLRRRRPDGKWEFWNRPESAWRVSFGGDIEHAGLSDATPSQIIAANVPDADIPACQIEGVRKERAKQTVSPSSPPTSTDSQIFDLADGRRIGVSADMSCGKPVLSVTELEFPSSPPPESGACQCEAANTKPSILSDSWRSIRKFDDAEKCIRQMVDDCLHDQSDNIKAHFVRSLRRHFEDLVYYAKFRRELARESLGVEANGKEVAA